MREFWLRPGWRLETVNDKKPKLFNYRGYMIDMLGVDGGKLYNLTRTACLNGERLKINNDMANLLGIGE
ncbi:hypothetical protein OMB55_00017730 [gamma proteobacterium HIMB55]|nr:hypothetical protein OMB55_00017730 [gamma proteobacterium HIMB55]